MKQWTLKLDSEWCCDKCGRNKYKARHSPEYEGTMGSGGIELPPRPELLEIICGHCIYREYYHPLDHKP